MNSTASRTIILHADDFGMNPAVNAGILAAFCDGLLTSTSLMTNGPAAEGAIGSWRTLQMDHQERRLPSAANRQLLGDDGATFDLGLHLNLTQGRPLTEQFPAELRFPDGNFLSVGQLYRRLWKSGNRYVMALQAEITAQLRWMLDHGLTPTHVNGHQYVELIPAVTDALIPVLDAHLLRIVRLPCESSLTSSTLLRGRPLDYVLAVIKRCHAVRYARRMTRDGILGVPRYFGTAHAGRVTGPLIDSWIRSTPLGTTVEIGLHPATHPTETPPLGWDDPLAALRPLETSLLTSLSLAEHLQAANVRLGRLADLTAGR